MKLRYFIVDDDQQLRRAARGVIESVWNSRLNLRDLPFLLGDELPLITVLCDDELQPRICYFLRLALKDGKISEESRQALFEAVTESNRYRFEHDGVIHQLSGWPDDWRRQVAVAMDVPLANVQKVGVGGPLPLADLLGVPLPKLLQYFEEAFSC